VLPILRGEAPAERGIGWMYHDPFPNAASGYAFRYGKWKLAVGGISCSPAQATFNCSRPQLYDMSVDIAEDHDLALQLPDVLAAIEANFSAWYASVNNSIQNESRCSSEPHPPIPVPFPPNPQPDGNCTLFASSALSGPDIASGSVADVATCCGACFATPECAAADFTAASPAKPTWRGEASGGTCHLKAEFTRKNGNAAQTAAHVPGRGR
jgi:hypothetical protein